MNKGWQTKKLASISSKITDGSHNPPKGGAESNYLMLSSKNVFDDDLHYEDPRYLSREQFEQEDRRTGVSPNDVLLTIVGTVGRSAVVPVNPPRITLQRSVAVIRPERNIVEPRFLMYSLIERSEDLNARARGVAQKGIYLETLRELEVVLPPLAEQQRIVGLLDEAFEGLATAKANAEKNLQNARALFKSHLQSVFADQWQIGELVTLADLATDITDGDHLPPPKSPTGVPFITIGNIVKETREIDFSDTFMVPRAYFDALKPYKKPRQGDVLYTVTGSFGIPVIVRDDTEFCFQRHIGLVRPKPETSSSWLYYLLMSRQLIKQANEGATGTAQKTVSLKLLRSFVVPKVSPKQQKQAVEKLDVLSEETQRLARIYKRKHAALEELKKSLLHQAFAGKL